MSKITVKENGLLFQMRDETIFVEPWGEGVARVRVSRNAKLSDEKWTLLDAEPCDAVISGDDNFATIQTGNLRVEMFRGWQCGVLSFFNGDKLLLTTCEESDPVTKFTHVEGDNYKTRILFRAMPGEHIYGIGQEQQDFFDRKGCTYDLMHWNTKSTLPIIYSSNGYGFAWNNPAPGKVEFGLNHTVWNAESCYQADYLVFAADTPAQFSQRLAKLYGYAPEMPSWCAGFWQCKLRYESQEDLLEVAREYHKRGIPVDAIVIDFFHWTQQGDWQFDPKYWPDPKAMVDELTEMGIRPVVSIWPTIHPHSKNWNKMNEENMLVRTENGQYGTFEFYGQITFVDPSNPATREFIWEQAKKNYYDYGIKTYWLDEAEPEVHPQQWGHLKFYKGNGAQTAMLYPYYYNQAYYEGLKKEGETEIATLTRAAYPGAQKFGAIVWNGDIGSDFNCLRQSIISGLSMGICGIPWWNSDIGGFFGGDIESDYFKELIVRWFQFGLFCPLMRLHGTRNHQSTYKSRHPGIICETGGDNEIWCFGERNYPILKSYIELRNRMRSYTLAAAKHSSETGEPIMRAMFYDFPEDEICYTINDQYMYGRDILFAPIYAQGVVDRKVYLPAGNWIRTSDKKVYEGGKWYDCHAEIDEFIAFVREGAEVINIF